MAEDAITVLQRHRKRVAELRAASRQARREHSPTGTALVGHLRLERELCTDLLAVEAAVTAASSSRQEGLRMLEAAAIASRSHAAAQAAEAQRRALESEQGQAVQELADVLSQASMDTKRQLLRVLEQDLAH
jgi:hypothetical protein